MRVHVLIENTAIAPEYASEHGLSLFIQTGKHQILFDFGQSGLFAGNADTMGLDLSGVDIAVLSHGHYDHGGGIPAFMEHNDHAPIYAQAEAFQPHAALREGEQFDAGLDPALAFHPRIRRVSGTRRLDEEITLFSGVDSRRLWPPGNEKLLKQEGGTFVPDDFAHELHLVVGQAGRDVLFTGCAHSGIADILAHAADLRGKAPEAAIGGFHLMIDGEADGLALSFGRQVAQALSPGRTRYYTGHCTGPGGVRLLEEKLPGRVSRLSGGLVFEPLA